MEVEEEEDEEDEEEEDEEEDEDEEDSGGRGAGRGLNDAVWPRAHTTSRGAGIESAVMQRREPARALERSSGVTSMGMELRVGSSRNIEVGGEVSESSFTRSVLRLLVVDLRGTTACVSRLYATEKEKCSSEKGERTTLHRAIWRRTVTLDFAE